MMAASKHRPNDDEYWVAPWATILFAGDVFQALPFALPPTGVLVDEEHEPAQHYIGEIAFTYGLLISPTCDMYEQVTPEVRLAHPFRVFVPILPLGEVVDHTTTVEQSINLLRSRDALHAYMYVPALEGHFEESVACLFRPTSVSDEFLREPPRRVAQMHPEARRHLKVKLAAYWARVKVEHDDLDVKERNEDEAVAQTAPPSPYDKRG